MRRPKTRLHRSGGWSRTERSFLTAVSLHRHTMYSEETMAPLPRYVHRLPVARSIFRAIEDRYRLATGRPFDYRRAFWTPPLPPQAAFAAERRQIEDVLGMAALVSLTDHDRIEAGVRLQVFESALGAPISMEWTVPLGDSFVHLGVHNLPPAGAHEWRARLAAYSDAPEPRRLPELLSALHDVDTVLVVVNHPLWDEAGIGAPRHRSMLLEFLSSCGSWIHALEMNGLRPVTENRAVLDLGEAFGYPVVSGGDSHASQPAALLNLAPAADFSSFVGQVRRDRISDVLVLPHYHGPHWLRYAACALDIVREYPRLAGRQRWVDRAFYRHPDGSTPPLAADCAAEDQRAGAWAFTMLRLGHSRPLRAALGAALAAWQRPDVAASGAE